MNADNLNSLFFNPDMSFEIPPLPVNPIPDVKRSKPGPARAWPAYRTDWTHLLDVEPSFDSPLHD